jgi:hypothetical protein
MVENKNSFIVTEPISKRVYNRLAEIAEQCGATKFKYSKVTCKGLRFKIDSEFKMYRNVKVVALGVIQLSAAEMENLLMSEMVTRVIEDLLQGGECPYCGKVLNTAESFIMPDYKHDYIEALARRTQGELTTEAMQAYTWRVHLGNKPFNISKKAATLEFFNDVKSKAKQKYQRFGFSGYFTTYHLAQIIAKVEKTEELQYNSADCNIEEVW